MKIYVCAHKPCAYPLPKDYEYIQVNAENSQPFCPLTDHTGDSISAKNPYYCELTAAYWIWKNDKENEIVGLAHYRRFLTENKFSSSPKSYLRGKRAEKLLERYDFIATKLYRTKGTVKEHLFQNVREKDFLLLRKSVESCFPDYLKTFDEVFSGHTTYLLNMFVAKKDMWDEYYRWLFCILSDLEQSVDMTGYSVQEKRLYGFLAERLFTVYVRKNSFRVKSFPTTIVGESKWKIAREKLLRIFRLR